MADLITAARAKYSIGGATNNTSNLTISGAEDTTISALVTACSKAIKKYCRREFDSQTFDELYDGNQSVRLALRQFPIISIARIAYGPSAVLRITNTSSSNQRATVAVTSSGISLVRVASGTVTTDTSIVFATYATLGTVATAINALGNGWAAAVTSTTYTDWPSADLRLVQGALNAKNVYASILLHTSELSSYGMNEKTGILFRDTLSDADVQFDSDDCQAWFGGRNYWRVIYTAGFATVPEDVQQACAEWVASQFWATKRDPGILNVFTSGTGTSYQGKPGTGAGIPDGIRSTIEQYRKPIV